MIIRFTSGGGCHAASIPALTAAQQGTRKSVDADRAVSMPSAIPSASPAGASRIATPLAMVPGIKRRGSMTDALHGIQRNQTGVRGADPAGPLDAAGIARLLRRDFVPLVRPTERDGPDDRPSLVIDVHMPDPDVLRFASAKASQRFELERIGSH
jgi:hypothetical protein